MTENLYLILNVFTNTFGMLDIWLILKMLFNCDMKLTKKTLGISAGSFAIFYIVISVLWDGQDMLNTLLIYLYIVSITLILTKHRKLRAVLLTIPAVLVYTQCGIIFDLFEKMLGLDQYYIVYEETTHITPFFCLTDFLMFLLLSRLWKYSREKSISLSLTLGEGAVLTFLCCTTPGILSVVEKNDGNRMYTILWTLFFLILNGMVIYAIIHRKKANYYRSLSENYKEQFTQEYSYFQDYKKAQKDTIKFRHDWKNHMLVLQEMLNRGDYENANVYFKELSEKTIQNKQKILTGNEMVDMILTSKMDVLEQEHIKLTCNGGLESLVFMEHVDCCILFSNLIDNAMEANQKVEANRLIDIAAHKTKQMLYVEISNPVAVPVEVGKEGIVSTKDNPAEHGIGLTNVYEIIEKYHGEYHILTKEQKFSFQMIFPL